MTTTIPFECPFRTSNMIPSSWIHKLKGMSRSKHKTTASSPSPATLPESAKTPPPADQRKSYYFTRDLHEPSDSPRKSSKTRTPTIHKKPGHRYLVSGEVNSAAVTPESVWTESPNSSETDFLSSELPASGRESVTYPNSNSWYDEAYRKVDLRPIITKPAKETEFGSGKWVMEEGGRRRVKGNSYSYSPRIGSRVRVQGINGGRRSMGRRRSLGRSMAVVKTSVDPQRDFKESMVEMIMENNIRSCKDLEGLLASYLSLNSKEYHALIIKVFKQIWFESTNIRL